MSKKYHLKYKYGISLESYNSLRKIQKFRCKICKLPESILNEELVVDHDHETGEVRGLLCRRCNVGLGMFQDSLKRVLRAAAYLYNGKNLTEFLNYANNITASAIKSMDYSGKIK